MILENQGKVSQTPQKQLRRALRMVRVSRRAPFPYNSALERIGLQLEAAYENYSMQMEAYNETYEALERAARAEDDDLKTAYAKHLLEIDELIDMNVRRVLAQGLCLERLMHHMMNTIEVDDFGHVLHD